MKHILRTLSLSLGLLLSVAMLGFAPSETGGERDQSQEIRWKPGQKLSWTDFKGSPQKFTSMDAMTESGIVFTWKCDYRGFQSEVYAMFDMQKSWVRRSEASGYLLRHEQAHFDITELHARKLRKRLGQITNPCRLGRGGIDRIAKKVYQESSDMQNQYDAETYHSKYERAQREWLEKIQGELKSLERWAK